MTLASVLRTLLFAIGGILVSGCAGFPRASGNVPNALSSFAVWSEAGFEPGLSAGGEPVDVIHVHGGEVMRIEVPRDSTVRIGERFPSGQNFVDSWAPHRAEEGVVLIRASAFTSALLLPRGLGVRAYRGHGSDPGYRWFELEDRVLAWANGPLPAPFPAVAPSERLDLAGFSALDQVLDRAVTDAIDHAAALSAARAVRGVAGLRAIRALRPASGLPYFIDSAVPVAAGVQAASGSRPAYAVAVGAPLELPVTGPALLHLWATSTQTAGAAELTVFEGARPRAETGLSALHAGTSGRKPPATAHAIIHVPPGLHRYRLESSAPLFVTPLLTEPIVHWEDASKKDEGALLSAAHHSCKRGGAPAICAISLALLGEDDARTQLSAAPTEWERALSASPEPARDLALAIARGAPRDPIHELERRGSLGDNAAQKTLTDSVGHSLDQGLQMAWVHALAQGSEWRLAESNDDGSRWTSVAASERDPAGCSSAGTAAATEVGSQEEEYQTVLWQGVPVVEFLVQSQCNDKRPVQLLVDGEPLTAAPSAAVVRWRVRVRSDRAKVRRTDASAARVSALRVDDSGCRMRFESLRPPASADRGPVLQLGSEPGAAGLELWLREGVADADVTVVSGSRRTRLRAPRAAGLTAFDDAGVLWTRVARVPLPAWASDAVHVTGGGGVAIRGLVRVARDVRVSSPHGDSLPPVALDEAALIDITQQILVSPPEERGALYLRRGLVLALGGARSAALADARAASQLDPKGPYHSDAVQLVEAAVRRHSIVPEPLPDGLKAYGIGADFDSGARVCQGVTVGPRAQFERLFTSLRSNVGSDRARFDPAVAASAAALGESVAPDPRDATVSWRTLAGSRWRLVRDVGDVAQRVRRPSDAVREGPVGPEGELRPRVVVGGHFAPGTYATVFPGRPAKASLAGIAPGSGVRVDVACAAREPALANAGCPIAVLFDGKPLQLEPGPGGLASVRVPALAGRPRSLVTTLGNEPGEWVALVRLVVDHPLPNGVAIEEHHWALAARPTEVRTLIKDGSTLTFHANGPSLLRLDARAESQSPAALVVLHDARERVIPADGTKAVLPLPAGGDLSLTARGGALSVAIAERVPTDSPAVSEARALSAPRELEPLRTSAVRVTLGAQPTDEASWLQRARRSPAPLSPLEAALGTFVAETGVVSGSLRQNAPSDWSDAYVFNLLGYRRRIESLQLWTRAEAFSRIRSGQPTLGAAGTLYEDLSQLHLRLTVSMKVEEQQIAGIQSKSWLSHGFVEYSYRASPKVFILPRLGYDGMYSTVARRPTSLAYVDDEVYSPYRARRPTFLFAQALLWYAPYFNAISYLRLRATVDAKAKALSHSAAVIGAFYALGDLDLSGQAQAIWYVPRDSLTNSAHVQTQTGVAARYSFWSGLGSLGITPGVAAAVRPQDGGWQATAFVNFTASFRRGLRDFSSLELDFPEQLSGGIPWRGETPGGYR